jgi:hypothetical protein
METYILDETDSDNMNDAIEHAVGKLNFLTRDIARGRLKKLNPAYRKVVITSSPNEISVTVDNQRQLRTPAKGAAVAWVSPDGGKGRLACTWQAGVWRRHSRQQTGAELMITL